MGRQAGRVEKGLANGFGQNNCFLNVVIQSLWHLSPFREKFSSWETHTHDQVDNDASKCVHCSLKVSRQQLLSLIKFLLTLELLF